MGNYEEEGTNLVNGKKAVVYLVCLEARASCANLIGLGVYDAPADGNPVI